MAGFARANVVTLTVDPDGPKGVVMSVMPSRPAPYMVEWVGGDRPTGWYGPAELDLFEDRLGGWVARRLTDKLVDRAKAA